MRIDASALAAEGLRYATAKESGPEDEVILGKCDGVGGFYESTPAARVLDAQASTLEIRRARWGVGAGGVSLEQPASLHHVELRLDIPKSDARLSLRLAVERAEVAAVRYEKEGLSIAAVVVLEGALVERDASGKLSVVAVSASLRDVELRAGETKLCVATAKARRVSLVSDGPALRISAERIELFGVQLTAGGSTVHAARLDAPRGVQWQDGRVELGEIELEGLEGAMDIPLPADVDEAAGVADATSTRLPDIAALDQLDGRIHVDVRVHATLPLLKERGATHALRLRVGGGAISFGELEGNFSAVVDALLDFEVEDDVLKLELDVLPIVKFDNVTLLSWKLVDPVDRQLAAQKSIRLRRLLQFERTSSKEVKPSKRHDQGAIRLLGVDFDAIAIDLSARAPMSLPIAGGTACFDDGEGHAIEALSVRGGIQLAIGGESKPGHLEVQAKGIDVLLRDLALGSVRIASANVGIAVIEGVRATFEGVRPRRIEGKMPTVRMTGVSLRVGD